MLHAVESPDGGTAGNRRRTVAVVGAGMAGLSCARKMSEAGWAVTVFDKSRGPSGRLSTRRRGSAQWDHGAPAFEAHGEAFRHQCAAWHAAGVLVPWASEAGLERWTGIPRMSALGRHLARGLTLHTEVRVAALARSDGRWSLTDTEGRAHGPFDQVVLAIPAPQAAELLVEHPAVHAQVVGVSMHPVHTLLVEVEGAPSAAPAVLRPEGGPLGLLVRNSAKPGRPAGDCWVAHTRPAWSQQHLELEPASLMADLVSAFREATGVAGSLSRCMVHRWRYAHADAASAWSDDCWWDPSLRLGLAGDWCAGGGVEAAWRSGVRLAQVMQATAWTDGAAASVAGGPADGEGTAASLA